jgi:hypothetical protein
MENAILALTDAKLAKTKTPVSSVPETELLKNVPALQDIGTTENPPTVTLVPINALLVQTVTLVILVLQVETNQTVLAQKDKSKLAKNKEITNVMPDVMTQPVLIVTTNVPLAPKTNSLVTNVPETELMNQNVNVLMDIITLTPSIVQNVKTNVPPVKVNQMSVKHVLKEES